MNLAFDIPPMAVGIALAVFAGLIIIGVGVYHVYKGASRSFLDNLKISDDKAATIAGVIGYCGKGVVLAGTGILVILGSVALYFLELLIMYLQAFVFTLLTAIYIQGAIDANDH